MFCLFYHSRERYVVICEITVFSMYLKMILFLWMYCLYLQHSLSSDFFTQNHRYFFRYFIQLISVVAFFSNCSKDFRHHIIRIELKYPHEDHPTLWSTRGPAMLRVADFHVISCCRSSIFQVRAYY